MKFSQSAPPRPPARNVSPPVQEPAVVWSGLISAASAHGLTFDEQSETGGPTFRTLSDEPRLWPKAASGVVCGLTDHSVLKVDGADAESFLQGQLTNDLAALMPGQAQRSGLCSPKGRLIADFLVVRTADAYLLLLSAGLAEPVRKRLTMFVLRAKVQIQDATQQCLPLGCLSTQRPGAGPFGTSRPEPMSTASTETGILSIALEPAVHEQQTWHRLLILMPAELLAEQLAAWPEDWPLAPTNWWHSAEVLAGTPRIGLSSSDAFVPQMINFELIGGVSFQKGCFPGQEVVARTQYLGKLKRRASTGWVDSPMAIAPGSEVTGTDDTVIGTVLVSGPGDAFGLSGRQLLLFETRLAALAQASPPKVNGLPLTVSELPYAIPVAERFERPDL